QFRKSPKRSGRKQRMQARIPEIQQVQKLPAVDCARIEIEGRCQRIGNAALDGRGPARRRRQKGIANRGKRLVLSLRQFHRNPTRAESNSLPAAVSQPVKDDWLQPAAALAPDSADRRAVVVNSFAPWQKTPL